jgi:hypothetical protein
MKSKYAENQEEFINEICRTNTGHNSYKEYTEWLKSEVIN